MCVCACVRACVRVRVCARARARVHACVRACVRFAKVKVEVVWFKNFSLKQSLRLRSQTFCQRHFRIVVCYFVDVIDCWLWENWHIPGNI